MEPFKVGDWVKNTGSTDNYGVIVKVIDDEWCDVFWVGSQFYGTIRRDGTVAYYMPAAGQEVNRVERVKVELRAVTA